MGINAILVKSLSITHEFFAVTTISLDRLQDHIILKRGINDVLLKQKEIKLLAAGGEKLTYIHERLLKAHGEAALIMSTF